MQNRYRPTRSFRVPDLLVRLIPATWHESQDLALIRRIVVEHFEAHWRGYGLALIMTTTGAFFSSLVAYLIGQIINATHLKQSMTPIVVLSLAWIALFAGRGLVTYWQDVLITREGNRITAETQRRIFDKFLGQGISYFADRHSTEFMANAVLGATAYASVLNQLVLALGRDLVLIISLVILMMLQDPLLLLVGICVLPPALFGVEKLVSRAREIAATQFSGTAAMLATMQETVHGFKIVKAFNLEGVFRARVEDNIQSLERASNALARVSLRSTPLIEAFAGMAIGLACLYGGWRVLHANGAPGQLVSFMMAFILLFDPLRRLARLKIDLGASLVGARALNELFDSSINEASDHDKPAIEIGQGRVELADVTFAYRKDERVLRALSLAIEPGKVTALVGPSGAGKTTIFNLILRFYDPGSGTITFDGQDAGKYSRASLRSQIAYVGQEVYLFNGTIRENILIGKPGASEDALIGAAKSAFAHGFIMAFPKGYDTLVGEAGSQLSLGQRQRIAVARALIKNAPIVLLDEPTASLDSESEGHVQEAIRRLCIGRTTIAIAHRLNTIRHADCIHVIDNGMVIESGQHDQLLKRNGRYATLFRLQFPTEPAIMQFEEFNASSDGIRNLGSGWIRPEIWGTWSEGARAEVSLELERKPVADVRMTIDARLYPVSGSIEQVVHVTVNDTPVTVLRGSRDGGVAGKTFYVPASVVLASSPMQIVFEIARPTAPAEIGQGGDIRKIGVGLKSISIEYH